MPERDDSPSCHGRGEPLASETLSVVYRIGEAYHFGRWVQILPDQAPESAEDATPDPT